MLTLIVRRLLLAIPTVVILTALLFFSVSSFLGSPAGMMLGQDASADAIAALNAKFGFDRPVWQQYLSWVASAFEGDLGRSYYTQQTVAAAILPAIPVTFELSAWSILFSTAAALIASTLPFGRRGLTPAISAISLFGNTVPNFMLAITLIFVFCVELNWLPTTGWVPWSDGVFVHLRHMILPVITLSAYYFGVFTMVYRAEFKDVMSRLYIHAARAKGLSESRVAFRHALPNAVLPVITFVGLSMGQLTGGAVVTETVFSMPGIGRLFVGAISGHDFPVMLAVGIMIVAGVVVMNLLADITYMVVNPQIRFD